MLSAYITPTHGNLKRLAELSSLYHAKGWLPATAGNLSFRNQAGEIFVTASGLDKGNLKSSDFINLAVEKKRKPSAETSIHLAIYHTLPEINCVIHLHTIESNILKFGTSPKNPVKLFSLPDNEIIKAFRGLGSLKEMCKKTKKPLEIFKFSCTNLQGKAFIVGFFIEFFKLFGLFTHAPKSVIVVHNFADVPKIGETIQNYYHSHLPEIPFLIIENHGITVWGRTVEETAKHIEAVDFLLKLAVAKS